MAKKYIGINEKNLMKQYYTFIRDDVRLGALVFPNGKQWLLMEQFDPETDKIILEDALECIHTAVMNIPIEDFDDEVSDENFEENIIRARSSENLRIINLEPEEKFKAFKSWVAGIAEAGINAFEIQAEIEAANHFIFPITDRLINFIVRVDPQFLPKYLLKIERESMFEGVRHEGYVISKLLPILNMILTDLYTHQGDITRTGRKSLTMILEFSPPDKIFEKNIDFCFLLPYHWDFYQNLINRLENRPNPNKVNIVDLVAERIFEYGSQQLSYSMSISSINEETNLIFIYLNNFLREIDISDKAQKKLINKHVQAFIKCVKKNKSSMRLRDFDRLLEMIYNWAESQLNTIPSSNYSH